MADKNHVFISYATKDAAFVNRLREDLARQNIPYWIDKEGLRPGTINWEKGIRQALRDAFAVIYVVTPASYASDNVQGEIAIAEVEGCTIYPIWADGDKWHDCVPIDKVKTQYIDMQGDKYELNRQVLFNALGGKRPDLVMPAPTAAILPTGVEPRNPYKGLNAFTEKDVADFFGRDKLISELLQAVKSRIDDRKDLLLTVIGASGSGKSSVVMAGLLPKLKAGALSGSDQWTYLKPMVPSDHPVQALAKVLYSAPGRSLSNKVIDEDLNHPNGIGLLTTAETLPKHPVVLYIDQFEELFMTGVLEEERQQFINLLINAVTQPNSPVLVLLTMRADFYDRPMNYPELGRLVQAYNRSVLPMTIADLRDTVEKPAVGAGLTFESGLIADIIFDLRDDKNAQAGALPLLQYTLEQLFERRNGNSLAATAYQEIGGVKGAIGAHAEEVFKELDEEAQNAFPRVFQALVHVDERGIPTRKREAESALINTAATARLVEALVRHARVLRVYTEKLGDTPYIEVAHEALLTRWERLIKWIESAHDDLRLIQEMKADAARWAADGYLADLLWSPRRLQPVYEVLKRLPQNLSRDEEIFVHSETKSLMEDFINRSKDVQLRMVQRDFVRIGKPALSVLIQAYGADKADNIKSEIIAFLWDFPEDVRAILFKSIKLLDVNSRVGAAQLITYFEMQGFDQELLEILNDDDNDVREAAVEGLAQVKDVSIVLPLMEVLKDKASDSNVRRAVVEALGETDDRSIVPVLVEVLKDNTSASSVRRAAVEVLGQTDDRSVVPVLLEVLRNKSENSDVRRAVVETLGQIGDQSVIPMLVDALKVFDPFGLVRRAAVEALGQIGDQSVISVLVEVLKDKASDSDIRRAAVEALGQIGDQSVISVLVEVLKDKASDSDIRRAVVKSLGQIEDQSVISVLVGVLKDKASASSVRRAAVEALRQIEDENVVTVLMEVLRNRSENSDVQRAAVEALGQIGDKSVIPVLVEVLRNRYEIRRAAVEALGQIGDQSMIPAVIQVINDKASDSDIRRAAVEALGQIGDESVIPVLVEVLRNKSQNSDIRRAAVGALGQIGDESVIPVLVEVLRNKSQNSDIRRAAVGALGQIGDESVIPVLVEALKDRSSDVRQAAAEALGKLNSVGSITELIKLIDHPFRIISKLARQALELMDIPESRAALAEYDAKHKG